MAFVYKICTAYRSPVHVELGNGSWYCYDLINKTSSTHFDPKLSSQTKYTPNNSGWLSY